MALELSAARDGLLAASALICLELCCFGHSFPTEDQLLSSRAANGTALYGNGSARSEHDANGSHGAQGSGHGSERFEVLKFDFAKVSVPFTISCWILVASIAKIGFHFSNKLSSVFPESSLLIVLGIIVGVIFHYALPGQTYHKMDATTFFYFLLPPIILESGYFMPNRAFFDNIGTILLYAVVGTLFNTVTIGFTLWGVANGLAAGSAGSNHQPTQLLHCLLFSSLISAVDPVAVLAVFEEIHVNEVLHIVVFGESLLNDAVTVVLYHMFEAYSHMGEENIQVIDVVAGAAAFFVVGIGGTVVGVFFGLIAVFITRFTAHVRVIEPIFVFLLAYLSYLFAEMFHFSGIMALTFCGIVMKQYVEFNISEKSHTTVKYFMKMLSSMSETIIFMFLGTSTVVDTHSWDVVFIVSTVVMCLVYRAIGVLLLTAVANKKRMLKLSYVDQFVMAYGGLRGAVAFALAITLNSDVIPAKNIFVTTTIIVVLFTVFVQGITIKPLVNALRVKKQEKRQLTMNEQINERLIDHLMAGVEDITGFHGDNWLRDKFEYYDNKYLKRYLLRELPKTRETGILRVSSKLSLRDAIDQQHRPQSSTMSSSAGLMAAQFNLLNEPSLTKIIRNWSNASLHDDGDRYHPTKVSGGEASTMVAENANGTVIDMQALEATYSKKMADDSKIHHILSDNMIRLRKRWTKRKRHELDDVENHPPFHHTMRLHLRHIISQHQRKQREKRSSSKRSTGRAEPAPGNLLTAEPAAAAAATHCRATKNVTFCDLALAEQPGAATESRDPSLKAAVPTFELKPPEEEEDFGITFKAKDDDIYPDEPPPTINSTPHTLPWRQAVTASQTDSHDGPNTGTFASQLLLTAAAGVCVGEPHAELFPRAAAAALHVTESTSSILPWRQVDESTPELSHRAQSDIPLAILGAAMPAFLDSSSESEESAPDAEHCEFHLSLDDTFRPLRNSADRLHCERSLAESASTSTLRQTSESSSQESVVGRGIDAQPDADRLPSQSGLLNYSRDAPAVTCHGAEGGEALYGKEEEADAESDDSADECTPLALRLRRAKNSFEALHSRLLKEKRNSGDDAEQPCITGFGDGGVADVDTVDV